MSCGSIEVFALRLAINIAIWIPLSILFFNILPRYSPRYARWLGVRLPLCCTIISATLSGLIFTIIRFLTEKC